MNDVLNAIADRRSIRAYTDEQITDQQLRALIAAAQQAPTAVNRQPYHFSFVQNRELLAAFSKAENEIMAQRPDASPRFRDPDYDVLYKAPTVCFLFAADDKRGVDCGIAAQTLALAAHSMGLGSVILGMPREVFADPRHAPKFLKAFHAPEGYVFSVAVAFGWPAMSKEAHTVKDDLISIIK